MISTRSNVPSIVRAVTRGHFLGLLGGVTTYADGTTVEGATKRGASNVDGTTSSGEEWTASSSISSSSSPKGS